jgi:hypothetical protein
MVGEGRSILVLLHRCTCWSNFPKYAFEKICYLAGEKIPVIRKKGELIDVRPEK